MIVQEPPEDDRILEELGKSISRPFLGFEQAFSAHPKEVFEAMIRLVRLRRAAPLYEKIGRQISLPTLKQNQMASRIAETIATWFPPQENRY